MKDITVGQNIAPLKPLGSARLIRPLCVPLTVGTDFQEEISGHWKAGVYSLWERLGLVYLEEEKPEPPRSDNGIIVNNFTQQLIFQLFSQKNTSRLIETNQPGFVLLDKVYRDASGSRQSAGAKLSATLDKRISEKTALVRELEKLLVLASDGGGSSDGVPVSEDMAALTVSAILRNAVSEKRITDRRIAVSQRILQNNSRQENTKTLLDELSELVREGGEDSAVLTESVMSRISEILRNDNSASKSAFLRITAEKAADLVQENYSEEQARQIAISTVASVFRSEQIRRPGMTPRGSVVSAANSTPADDAVSGEGSESGVDGKFVSPSVGTVLPEQRRSVSEAAMFLLEQTVEEVSQTGGAAGLGLLPAGEIRELLRKTADRNAAQLVKLGGVTVERAVGEAFSAALSMKNAAKASNRASGNNTSSVRGESASVHGMSSSLMRRAAGYVSDKLNYEKGSSMSQISSAGGENFS